jgi:putative membrane protein
MTPPSDDTAGTRAGQAGWPPARQPDIPPQGTSGFAPLDDADGWATVPPPPAGVVEHAASGAEHAWGDGERAGDGALGGALHPAVIGVWSTARVGALVFLFVINPAALAFALPFIGVLVASSVVRWQRFRWRVADGALIIESGLLNRQRRVIPVERIQSVDVVRRLSHRLFGVVGVQVEAIGGSETEGQLDALSPAVATRLRATLLAGRAAARGDATAARQVDGPGDDVAADTGVRLASTSPRRLLVAGLTEANGTLIVGLIGLLWQLFGDRIDDVAQRLPALLAGNVAVVAVVAALLLAVLLLIAAQMLAFWGFTLHRGDEELRVRRGLLEQRFDTIPLRRLQALRVEQNLPRRLLGLASVKADVAGKPGGGSGGTDTLLPIGRLGAALELVDAVFDLPGTGAAELEGMPGRARRRRLVRAVAAVVPPAVAVGALLDPRGYALLLLLVPAWAAAEASYRALGHAELPAVVVVRAGWWVRRTAFVPTDRLQALAVDASLFQRRRSLATLRLGIARSAGLWNGPQMIDLDRDRAFELVGDLAPVAARSRRRVSTGVAARTEEDVAPQH